MCCPILKSLDALFDKVSLNIGAASAPFLLVFTAVQLFPMWSAPGKRQSAWLFSQRDFGGNQYNSPFRQLHKFISVLYYLVLSFFYITCQSREHYSPLFSDNVRSLLPDIASRWKWRFLVWVYSIKVLKSKVSCTCLMFLEDSIFFYMGGQGAHIVVLCSSL